MLTATARRWSWRPGTAALYSAWHTDTPDDFGYDPGFARTLEPWLRFLYRVWWRVEATSVDD